jgi:S-adenosylmethionine:tRNA ribosyltransferase-isomerase
MPSVTHSSDIDRLLSSYDYELPEERIAQTPVSPRDTSRLLVVTSPTHHTHNIFRDLPQLLKPGDLLVLNNTRVIQLAFMGVNPQAHQWRYCCWRNNSITVG